MLTRSTGKGFTASCGLRSLITTTVFVVTALPCVAGSFRVLQNESDLVVVTRKAGIAKAAAHDHVVAATAYEAHLEFLPQDPESATFDLKVPVRQLVADDPAVQARVGPRLEQLGVRDGEFPGVPERDRSKIRAAMLSKKQLDADRYPTISATAAVAGRRDEVGGSGDAPLYAVRLRLEIHGRTVEREASAWYEYRSGRLEVEALASFEFTEFGIKPYSAFFGAVRNRNEFHIYVRLVAVQNTAATVGHGRGQPVASVGPELYPNSALGLSGRKGERIRGPRR